MHPMRYKAQSRILGIPAGAPPGSSCANAPRPNRVHEAEDGTADFAVVHGLLAVDAISSHGEDTVLAEAG